MFGGKTDQASDAFTAASTSEHTALVGVLAYRQRAAAAGLRPDPPDEGRPECGRRPLVHTFDSAQNVHVHSLLPSIETALAKTFSPRSFTGIHEPLLYV